MKTEENIEKFKKDWGIKLIDIIVFLEESEDEVKKFLDKYYFYLPETEKYYPLTSDTFTLEEKAIVSYLSGNVNE